MASGASAARVKIPLPLAKFAAFLNFEELARADFPSPFNLFQPVLSFIKFKALAILLVGLSAPAALTCSV